MYAVCVDPVAPSRQLITDEMAVAVLRRSLQADAANASG
jgi:hypothetical protein